MSFADELRAQSPEAQRQQKQEVLREVEEDPSKFAMLIANLVESVVKREATDSSRAGKTGISGYIIWRGSYEIRRPSDWSIYFEDFALTHDLNSESYFLCVDKLRIGALNYNFVVRSLFNVSYEVDCYTLSQKTVDVVCTAVRNKLKELGFQQFSVVPKIQECARTDYEPIKTLFGRYNGTKAVTRPNGTATALWIEVSW